MGGAILICCIAFANPPLAVVTVDRDNIEITQSCVIQIGSNPIIDADNNGVIHITRPGITVDLNNQHLHGANAGQSPDTFSGTGIKITATDVTLHNAIVSGYKVGIHAINADGLHIHHCEVSNNFHQRLKSTPRAEDASDWLWPHYNDNNEWITNYGAGLCVEDSRLVRVHDIRARKTQNGIILDRVNESKVYDCDCSFLSGWGLAMWRSNRNVISRNAFDFCVRGYSHGVYNRGQDSAGILMFEQCCENIIAENSATHCGDGFFGFAGKEALGEVSPREDVEWYKRRGCNKNIIVLNDFSHAVAHGLELTFSFHNRIEGNTFRSNAICGIWGGYSSGTVIRHNHFAGNGDMGYGSERGGIAIEHGAYNIIALNEFAGNRCGIRLWWDEDEDLLKLPWAKANGAQSVGNQIVFNRFTGNDIALELDRSTDTILNLNEGALLRRDDQLTADDLSRTSIRYDVHAADPGGRPVLVAIDGVFSPGIIGERRPVVVGGGHPSTSARVELYGRENIIMTDWGPWDHESPMLQFIEHFDHADRYRVLGVKAMPSADSIRATGDVLVDVHVGHIFVNPGATDTLIPYTISFDADGRPLTARGVLTGGTWEVWTFNSACDPREDIEGWRREGTADHHTLTADRIDFRFGSGGMSEARELPAVLPRDHFGIIATRTLTLPPGRWRFKTTSDDGIRVWMDDALVIDDWTWHPPKEHMHEFELDEAREVNLRVEYFELDGYAILALDIESQ